MVKFLFYLLLALFVCSPALASPPGQMQILEGHIAHEGHTDHPSGCLPAWPNIVTISGEWSETTYSEYPTHDLRSPEKTAIFIDADRLISTCAFKVSNSEKVPSYVDIRKIGFSARLSGAAKALFSQWGNDDVRIIGGLSNSSIAGKSPSYVIFTHIKRICVKVPSLYIYRCVGKKYISTLLSRHN